MAIDTRNKRASVVHAASGASYPTADGSLSAGDRAHITREYRGLFDAVTQSGQAVLPVSFTVTTSGTVSHSAGASLTCTWTLAANGVAVFVAQASPTISFTVSAAAVASYAGQAVIPGTFTLTVGGGVIRGASSLQLSTFTVSALQAVTYSGQAALPAIFTVTSSGLVASSGSVVLSAAFTITAAGSTPLVVWTSRGPILLYEQATGASFAFESTLRQTTGTAYARCYDLTAAAAVASSQVSTASATKVRVRSGTISLTNGNEYEAQSGLVAGDGGELWGAKCVRTN